MVADSGTAEDRKRYERLRSMGPSPKLVFLELTDANDPLNAKTISERTLLPRRTVRYALNELSTAGLVESKPDVRDARTNLYVAYTIEHRE